MDSDGRPDLVVGTAHATSLFHLTSAAEGQQAARIPGWASRIHASDVNADGLRDLILTGWTGVGVWHQQGDGGFSRNCLRDVYADIYDIAIGDFDADDLLDVVVAQHRSLVLLRGRAGGGLHSAALVYVAGWTPYLLGTADLNGDGMPDLVVAGEDFIGTLLGRGDGSFEEGPHQPVEGTPRTLRVVDINLDGIPDVVGIQHTPDHLFIMLASGGGHWHPPRKVITQPDLHDVVVTDFNEDSLPDLLVGRFHGAHGAYQGEDDVSLYLNGSFCDPQADRADAGGARRDGGRVNDRDAGATRCRGHHHCPQDERCNLYTSLCEPAPTNLGTPCVQDSECHGGNWPMCVDHDGWKCASSCGMTLDCPVGFRCEVVYGYGHDGASVTGGLCLAGERTYCE
ncbi:MAG: VCBS repeat-containing protein [Myxococcota bacterium]